MIELAYAWPIATLLVALLAGWFIALASHAFAGEGAMDTEISGSGRGWSARDPLIVGGAFGIAAWAVLSLPGPMGAFSAVLGWWLLLIAILDAEQFWLPDRLTLPLIVFGLVSTTLIEPARWLDHVLGAAAGYAILVLLAAAYERYRGQEGLGGGDPKLLAAGGAFVGWMGLPSVMLWASGAGLAVALIKAIQAGELRGTMRLPFGTYLAIGIWLTWLYGPIGRG